MNIVQQITILPAYMSTPKRQEGLRARSAALAQAFCHRDRSLQEDSAPVKLQSVPDSLRNATVRHPWQSRGLLARVFRFIHYNNRAGWKLTDSWQAAYLGFKEKADYGTGPADVPVDWIPHIAGVDG